MQKNKKNDHKLIIFSFARNILLKEVFNICIWFMKKEMLFM